MSESNLTAIGAKLVDALNHAHITRLVARFDYRAEEGAEISGYELYQPWDHGRGGVLYIEAKHEYEPLPDHTARPGRRPKCRLCGEGPLDGDHYGAKETSPEPAIVELAQKLVAARFMGCTSAAGHIKADTESLRIWFDVAHEERVDPHTPTLQVEP